MLNEKTFFCLLNLGISLRRIVRFFFQGNDSTAMKIIAQLMDDSTTNFKAQNVIANHAN